MKKFYHLDRKCSLEEGKFIKLINYDDVMPRFLQEHVDNLFPDGFTSHGENHFLSNNSNAQVVDNLIEILIEYVRRSNYENRPSRFQSIFAFLSLDDLIEFVEKLKIEGGLVWEVISEEHFIADMSLLSTGNSILEFSYNAHLYWQGKESNNPMWEILLQPPIKVLNNIPFNAFPNHD